MIIYIIFVDQCVFFEKKCAGQYVHCREKYINSQLEAPLMEYRQLSQQLAQTRLVAIIKFLKKIFNASNFMHFL